MFESMKSFQSESLNCSKGFYVFELRICNVPIMSNLFLSFCFDVSIKFWSTPSLSATAYATGFGIELRQLIIFDRFYFLIICKNKQKTNTTMCVNKKFIQYEQFEITFINAKTLKKKPQEWKYPLLGLVSALMEQFHHLFVFAFPGLNVMSIGKRINQQSCIRTG